MSKQIPLTFEGVVQESLPSENFRVKLLDNDHVVIGYLAGRMVRNKIRVTVGDRVRIEITPYDLDRGRITRRL